MGLRVVGAGLGRTGTYSLKLALERLLGAPCYHMVDVFSHPERVSAWHSAAVGKMPDWNQVLAGYAAAVDWPVSAFWPELSAAFPDALVLLSVRTPESWWDSARETIFRGVVGVPNSDWSAMIEALSESRFVTDITDRDLCIAAFERHNARVRESVPPERLLEWHASEGWEPICAALGLPVPSEPFPHMNTRQEFVSTYSGS